METIRTEHPSHEDPVTDIQRTVDKILEIARVLYHLDQVVKHIFQKEQHLQILFNQIC